MFVAASAKIPIVICIDIEPDERAMEPHTREDWQGFEETWKYFAGLRPSLELATQSPVRFSWFLRMDPQISHVYGSADWAVTRYQEFFAAMRAAGDEIGLHPHAWRWDETHQEWIADFADQKWIEHCVRQSFAEFKNCFRRPCLSVRFGDRWTNNQTVKLFDQLHAKFDLTIEPGRKPPALSESFSGSLPDYSLAPRCHYHPSKSDFLQPGRMLSQRKLWMIPVTTGSLDWVVSRIPVMSEAHCQRNSPIEATYEGTLDRVDQGWLVGWVYNTARPDETVVVDIYDNDKPLGRYAADIFRSDLLLAGKGSGAHSFFIPIPQENMDGTARRFGARVGDFELGNSPVDLVWGDNQTRADYITQDLADNSGLFCKLFDSLLSEQNVSHLVFVVRTEAVLSEERRIYMERNFNHIMSHPLAGNFAVTTPAEAIQIMTKK